MPRNLILHVCIIPVQEIDNVTICGLQERRNETVKACRVKIISWRDF